ncbi:hypothetical protein ACQP3C_25565, partial [Escherichia coli]
CPNIKTGRQINIHPKVGKQICHIQTLEFLAFKSKEMGSGLGTARYSPFPFCQIGYCSVSLASPELTV